MKALIEQLYNCTVIQWDEFDGEVATFSAIQHGQFIMADSLDSFILALAPLQPERIAA